MDIGKPERIWEIEPLQEPEDPFRIPNEPLPERREPREPVPVRRKQPERTAVP